MVDFARGVAKTITIAKETALGTASVASGQYLRRISSDLNLNITPIESQEILPSQQVRDYRNGPRQIGGTLQGQLSPGSYQDIFQGVLRKDFVAGGTASAVADTVLTNTTPGTSNMTLVSAATNWITSGFKAGDVVRITGATGGSAVVNGDNFRVLSVTASPHTMTLAPNATAVGWASGQTISIAVAGKKLWIPASGQVYNSYTIEHWFSDVSISDVFLGNRITQLALNIPASGFVTMNAGLTGLNQTTAGSQAYPSATAASASGSLTAVDGKINYNGSDLAYITGFNLQIAPAVQTTPVIGSNILPEVFLGTLAVRGSLTCLFKGSDSFTADFLAETELSLQLFLTSSPADNAEFISIYLPRVKLSSSQKSDSDRAIMRSFNFMALEKVTGAGSGTQFDATTIVIQDSNAT